MRYYKKDDYPLQVFMLQYNGKTYNRVCRIGYNKRKYSLVVNNEEIC